MATKTLNSRTEKSSNTKTVDPVEPNYFQIQLCNRWDERLLIPASKINALMEVLSCAELITSSSNSDTIAVTGLRPGVVMVDVMSTKEVTDIKMAQLLGMSYTEYTNQEVA